MSTRLALIALLLVLSAGEAQANLITNGDFSAGNIGFTTGYTFATGGQTTPGTYGITTNPSTTFSNGYASFGPPIGTGAMLFFDGTSGSTPIWSETIGSTPNAVYDFSAWATSGITANAPILRLTVNGAEVGPDFAVDGTTPGQWQNLTASFTPGFSTSFVLALFDVNPRPFVTGNDGGWGKVSLTEVAVPEPSSLLLMAIAVPTALAFGVWQRRKLGCAQEDRPCMSPQ